VKCCSLLKTQALLNALRLGEYDGVIGGARREEERSRAKERIYSFRDEHGQWDPKNQRPELWNLYNGRVNPGESIRIFPLSNWTELDICTTSSWRISRRPALLRQGARRRGPGRHLIPVGEATRFMPDEKPQRVMCRYRTLGCYPCTGAVRSTARTVHEIVEELKTAKHSSASLGSSTTTRTGPWSRRSARVLLTMSELRTWLHRDGEPELLRFTTAGSVDDGKSTLIGRLLHDVDALYEDHVEALKKRAGGRGDEFDFSLITDGLKAEREQGITIDVAYRYFATAKRRFIIADTPGHEQYTRNMATGASTADLAVTLIDARLGVLTQSKRHAFISSLLACRGSWSPSTRWTSWNSTGASINA